MARTSKVNWVLIKQEYIGKKEMSLTDIAKKYPISYSRVTKVSMKEGWIEEKKRIWGEAEKEALVETEGSIKDLIKRHSKVARYLQAGGIRSLKLILDEVEEKLKLGKKTGNLSEARTLIKSLIFNKIISAGTLTTMIAEGLKAERELYPKQMQIEGDLDVKFGEVSDELKKAAHEALIKIVTEKPRKANKHS